MADFFIKDVRLSFPNLWKAKEFKPGDGKPRFDATFLVVPGSENAKKIHAAIAEAAGETYGAKADKMLAGMVGNGNKYCYLDGNLKDYDGYEGMMYLACHSRTRPSVFDRDGKTPLAEDDGKPYGGCYVNAKVSIYAQAGENPGIRASFSGIQFVRDGDAFGGGRAAAAGEFEDLGTAPAEDLA